MTDTAALDAWLAVHLLGWRPPGRERVDDETDRIWTGYLDPDGNLATPPKLSTTGDGRELLEKAVEARGWTWSTGCEHRAAGTLYDAAIYHGNDYTAGVGESLVSANVAFAQAARAALEAEA